MTEQTHTDACAQMGATVEQHKSLEPFVGTFKAQVKLWMGPGDPHVSTGVMTNSFELDGRFLKQVFQGDSMEGPFPNFQGRGYWGYNTTDKQFEGFWIDTASTMIQIEKGSVDASGKVWTMVSEMTSPQGGGKMKKRSVITLTDKDHHKMEMYFSTPNGDESKGMEITYQRTA